jgi:oligopeptide transport system permease protein
MLRFIIRRLLHLIPVLFVVATATFFLMRAAPGGPFDGERQLPPEVLHNINARYHLDEPLWQQYLRYLGMLLQGDLGPSYRYADRSVNEIIASTFPISAAVGGIGLLFALVMGVGAGIFAASKLNSWRDYTAMFLALLGISLPSFVIGPLLILVFSLKLGWFNVSGFNHWRDLMLPGLTLGIMYAAFFARLTRGGISEIIRQDFIRTAKAKGLSGRTIMLRHTLKGGLLPVTSFLGPAATAMLTGSLVVETIFNIPGLGRFFVQSALNRDYTMVMGCVLFLAVMIVVMNLLVDIAYALLDPRVTYD